MHIIIIIYLMWGAFYAGMEYKEVGYKRYRNPKWIMIPLACIVWIALWIIVPIERIVDWIRN